MIYVIFDFIIYIDLLVLVIFSNVEVKRAIIAQMYQNLYFNLYPSSQIQMT